ncbi:GTP 3',8-cyclase MoaA [Gorillibacterium sp. sgz5001074]|uniref:GTP 3',8-cyclase MoaA n=1 Tax=Gorillibacterium sp. sgz5001074 TaxID=3446695 RepID=UPI003F670616
MAQGLTDGYGRTHDYLRISVTDRCNLRCVYCMPAEGMEFEPDEKLLTFDEMEAAVRVMAGMGIRKLRLTGGEPLTRKGLEELVARLAAVPGIEDIALTTNGIFLARKAEALKAAGLNRVNISLDSLQADRFRQITRGGDVRRVLEAVEESLRVGLEPVKLNVVLMKGYNEEEIADFLRLTLDNRVTVRFIEYMPIGGSGDTWRSRYLPLSTVLKRCKQAGWIAEAEGQPGGNGPAEYYRIRGAAGVFGLIHPVSDHFCSSCNRLRLTADGYLKTCLYWSDEQQIRRYAGDPEGLERMIRRAVALKPKNHEMALDLQSRLENGGTPTARTMSQIGG